MEPRGACGKRAAASAERALRLSGTAQRDCGSRFGYGNDGLARLVTQQLSWARRSSYGPRPAYHQHACPHDEYRK